MNLAKIIKISVGIMVTAWLIYSFMTHPHVAETPHIGIQFAGEIPEPATSLLITAGGLWLYRRKRRK